MKLDNMGLWCELPVAATAPKLKIGTTTYAIDIIEMADNWKSIQLGVLVDTGNGEGFRWHAENPVQTSLPSAFPKLVEDRGGMSKFVEWILDMIRGRLATIKLSGTVTPTPTPTPAPVVEVVTAVRSALSGLKLVQSGDTITLVSK